VYATRAGSLALLALVACASPALAQAKPRPPVPAPALSAEAVLLLDPEGKALYAKNAEIERAPASLVKLMTLYLACEAIEAGRVTIDDLVTISPRAALTPRYRMGLRAGDQVPLMVLLEGVAIASANDAAAALAEHLGGDETTFVGWMNNKATELGLTGTHFANPHGLPDPDQHSTATDLAHLTARLLADHPMSRPLLGGQTFVYNGRVYARHIPLFNDPGGVQALKTGFTNEAGYNLAVSAWRNGQQFLMIVLGARTRAQSFLDAKRLLRYGFVESGLDAPVEPKPARAPRRGLPPRHSAAAATAVPAGLR
jgi:D-alanyl-D-alanine carboxypeptidase (penicillin-binding protein 5/6)